MSEKENCHSPLEGSSISISAKPGNENGQSEKWGNCPPTESPCKSVKSTAVVKYSSVQSLANFALLQCNTDLNLPPSNWLRSSADSYGLQHVPSHSTGFSSFRLAHMFPECVGEVDVVSDAENIKKLLKIPYSRGPVSMMVHRVENTLLIDEFDIHKHLLRTAETEWEWLKKFFYDNVLQSLSDKEKAIFHKNKSRYALQQKSLVSKFLYHSLAVAEPQTEQVEQQDNIQHVESSGLPVQAAEPPLPEPTLEEELPDPTSSHNFARNVVWTFEDIQMLIGTNLPIFGGSTHPCVSLRLRDVSKPINVLTGIDYWLDNLMCNVPELVMCYHLDGIVQKYELIKTEDLPHLENSKFSPKVIRDVAQNILSFLKSNATKAGHTYWLFKGKDAEIVKLYDLTSLCTDVLDDRGQNPFTVPVAMLLYRVARNMKHSQDGQRQQGTIQMLLENCIELLPEEKYPQIVTSAHYMLSDLYIPADTDPASPNLSAQLDEESSLDNHSDYDEEEGEGTGTVPLNSVDVKSLCLSTATPASDNAPPPPLGGGVEQRCKLALKHVAAGLHCLQFFDTSSEEQQKSGQAPDFMEKQPEPENPKMARPFEAIPMPYAPLKSEQKESTLATSSTSSRRRKKVAVDTSDAPDGDDSSADNVSLKALLCKYRAEAMPTWHQSGSGDKMFWKGHLRNLLYEKACLVYVTLTESDYIIENYGSALRYIKYVLHYQEVMEFIPNRGLQSYLLGRAGDLCFMLVQNWSRVESYRLQYTQQSEMDKQVMEEMMRDANTENRNNSYTDLIPATINSMEQMLLASCVCYKRALELEPVDQQRNNLLRRLGNIQNELGVLYMNQAAARYQEETAHRSPSEDRSTSVLQSLFSTSLHHLEAGIQAFEAVKDEANTALLYSNTGRLMRMCAHFHSPTSVDRSELTGQERHFYNKALDSYQKAIQVLGTRKRNPVIWDTVTWELSTTLFSMATLLQDFPSLNVKVLENVLEGKGLCSEIFSSSWRASHCYIGSDYLKALQSFEILTALVAQSPEYIFPKSQDEAEREVVDFLLKALKYCDLETAGVRQPVYQFRAASIHHRLASLYHKSYRNSQSDDPKRKNILQLCRLHYEKASRLLLLLEHPSDFLRVQMERVALAEFQAQNATGFNGKLKALQNALELLLQTSPILNIMKERTRAVNVRPDATKSAALSESSGNAQMVWTSVDSEDSVRKVTKEMSDMNLECQQVRSAERPPVNGELSEEELVEKEEESLLQLLEQRLQFILLQLVKIHHGKGGQSKKEVDSATAFYKHLYSVALKKDGKNGGIGLVNHLVSVLSQIEVSISQPNSANVRVR